MTDKAVHNGVPQLTVQQLKQRMDAGEKPFLLDVREPYEYEIANLGGVLIPQNDVARRLSELDPSSEIIVHCRSGVRSQRIAEMLQKNGFARVENLSGGILAWAEQIDPTMQKY